MSAPVVSSRSTLSPATRRVATSLALLLAVPASAAAQSMGTVTGRVTDASSGTPVADAQVRVVGSTVGVMTRTDGTYRLVIAPGRYELRVSRIGYAAGAVDYLQKPLIPAVLRAKLYEAEQEKINQVRAAANLPAYAGAVTQQAVLDQLIYKWDHSRGLIAGVLVDKYADIAATGWIPSEEEIRRDVRLFFQHATEREFIETVEQITGRRVRAFVSGIDVEQDISSEVFYLEPLS